MAATLQEKIEQYQPSAQAVALVRQTKVLLLVGISGAGKDTVRRHLVAGGGFHNIVSHTTRPPRENHGVLEREGVEYHFVSLATAEQMVDEQAFIEAKYYSGNLYGTSVEEIEAAHASGEVAVADIEVQGVEEYKLLSPAVNAVFLLPPNYKTWQERLRQRYGDGPINEQDIAKRMHTAHLELQHALDTDYFNFVINDDLEQTIMRVRELSLNPVDGAGEQQNRSHVEHLAKELSLVLN